MTKKKRHRQIFLYILNNWNRNLFKKPKNSVINLRQKQLFFCWTQPHLACICLEENPQDIDDWARWAYDKKEYSRSYQPNWTNIRNGESQCLSYIHLMCRLLSLCRIKCKYSCQRPLDYCRRALKASLQLNRICSILKSLNYKCTMRCLVLGQTDGLCLFCCFF